MLVLFIFKEEERTQLVMLVLFIFKEEERITVSNVSIVSMRKKEEHNKF